MTGPSQDALIQLDKLKSMNIQVSIVDDDETVRNILEGWLSRAEGFDFISGFQSGEDCLLQLPIEKPDIVLMDIKLPGISGVECIRRLKPQMQQTQFIMHTVFEDFNHILVGLQFGATGYLLKQSSHDELLASLRYVHEGGSPMTSCVARRIARLFPEGSTTSRNDERLLLSARERKMLEMLAHGFSYDEIAGTLGTSVKTMNTYIRRIYEKLHKRSRSRSWSNTQIFSRMIYFILRHYRH